MRGSGFDVFLLFFALTYTYKKGRFRLSFVLSFHPSFPTTFVSIGCTISGVCELGVLVGWEAKE